VDRLVSKQLVKKVICAKDRRLVDVTITDKGQSLLKKLDAEVNDMENVSKNLTNKEAEMISALLDKLREGKR
jgi:DNA-binding MarR family transcriptional regulator